MRRSGFTLIELAIVLVIVGLILGGGLEALSGVLLRARVSDTQQQLRSAREALLDYAVLAGRLPCPAQASSHGVEVPDWQNIHDGACTAAYDGYLPARSLGIARTGDGLLHDAWGEPIRYAITLMRSNDSTFPYTPLAFTTAQMADGADSLGAALGGYSIAAIYYAVYYNGNASGNRYPAILICSGAAGIIKTGPTLDCAAEDQVITRQAVAVIWSTGGSLAVGGADEAENLAGDRFFIYHEPREDSGVGGHFAHQMEWINANTLIGRLVTAGRLP